MNTITFSPIKMTIRFVLGSIATFLSMLGAGMIISPFMPDQGSVDASYIRLLMGYSIMLGGAMLFMIRNSRYYGKKLLGLMLLAYIAVAQLQQHVETIFFNFVFEFTAKELIISIIYQALSAIILVPLLITVAGKWKRPSEEIEDKTLAFDLPTFKYLIPRLIILAFLWYVCYFVCGFVVADPITHSFYLNKNPRLADMNGALFILQLFRGLGWTGLIVLGLRIMNRPLAESGLIIGLIYGVFQASVLLLPNPLMPVEIRLSHLPEIILSLVLFSSLVIQVLGYKKKARTKT